MNNIKLPTLYCPFPSGINPHFDKTVNQHTLDWARSFNLLATDESVYQSLGVQQLPTFAARFYPNASLEAIQILCDYWFWMYTVDEQSEKAGISKQLELLESEHARLIDILKGAEVTDGDAPTARALRDIQQRLHQLDHGTPELMLRFAKDMEDYFQATRWEALNHLQGITPDVATYMRLRLFTTACYPFFHLIPIVDEFALALEIISHPVVKQLQLATNNFCGWSERYFFCRKGNAGREHSQFNSGSTAPTPDPFSGGSRTRY